MNVQEAYSDWSATYDSDRNLTRDLDELVTRMTLESLRCESILEIGCGTGKNTALLARIGKKVHALDFSEGMIARAKAKFSFDNVTFEVADITLPWPCKDRSFDLIACNLVLEHVRDLSFIFAEAARVMIESGQFYISELHPFRQYEGVQAHFKRDDETIEIPAFVHHISDFLDAATRQNLSLVELKEWWHEGDEGKPPRLISLLFTK